MMGLMRGLWWEAARMEFDQRWDGDRLVVCCEHSRCIMRRHDTIYRALLESVKLRLTVTCHSDRL